MNKGKYYKLWKVYNAKVKNLTLDGLREHKEVKGFTKEELLQIINYLTMSVNNPIDLLWHVLFFNAILLGLCNGKHFNLKVFYAKR